MERTVDAERTAASAVESVKNANAKEWATSRRTMTQNDMVLILCARPCSFIL